MLYPGSFVLTSTMYPVEVFEEAAITPPSFGAEMWEQPLDATETAPPTFNGTHVQTLFLGAYSLDEYAEVVPPAFSGTHVQTLFNRAYSLDDYADVVPPTFSGTHVQTLFPLTYLHELQEAVIAPPTFTGSLV